MLIISWNVNSVRTRQERLVALLQRHQPDLLCLQETKCTAEAFPHAALAPLGYRAVVLGQKAYNGVALVARQGLTEVQEGFAGDPAGEQARVLSGRLGPLRVFSIYAVNGQAIGTPSYALKLAWYDALGRWLEQRFSPEEPLLLLGDFNVAPEERDVYDPQLWQNRVLVSVPERQRLQQLLAWGLRDLLREQTQEAGIYTWWDYRAGALHRGWGLRIDLALGSAPVAAACREVRVDRQERLPTSGPGKPSDHAPLLVSLDL